MEQGKELDKAKEDIVRHETSLKQQETVIISLEKGEVDLKSKNDKLLKDNAKLNQQLETEKSTNDQLERKLKQTKLQAQQAEEALRKK